MPSYDFRCENCKKRVVLTYKTYREYFAATPTCSHCGSTKLTRLITRVGIARSESSRLSELSGDDSALDDLADADPATLGRYLRKMGDEAGEDLGEEFNDVVGRLESGEDPELIDSSLGGPEDAMSDAMGGLE